MRDKLKNMRTVLFFLLFVSFSLLSKGQVNRYSKPAESTFRNTYVSPDYDLLFKLGTMAKQRKMETQRLIQKTVNLYHSYPNYPQKIGEGWHNTICLSKKNDYLKETKTYVNFNNEVTMVDMKTEIISDLKEQIINGKSQVGNITVLFLKDIWLYNKNYKNKTSQEQNIITDYNHLIGRKAKIKDDFHQMLDIIVLRTQPNPNSAPVYKFSKSDLSERLQILEDKDKGYYIKVKFRDRIGYISYKLLNIE